MLLERIERYMRGAKMSPTRFGREALGDPNFVLNLQEGRCPRRSTVNRVLAFIKCHEASADAEEPRR